MGRTPCCAKVGLHRGPWTPQEDLRLSTYIQNHGEGRWRTLPTKAGLLRCGKSCRLRWINYLRPDVKRGHISPEEEDLILRLHGLLGNKWALIAGRIPGRTDNEIKNYWNSHLCKKLISQGIDPRTHKPLSESPKVCVSSGYGDVIPEFLGQEDLLSSLRENIVDPRLSAEVDKEDEPGPCTWTDEFIDDGFKDIAACDPVHHDLLASCFSEGELKCTDYTPISPRYVSSSRKPCATAHKPFNNYLMPGIFDRSSYSPAVPVMGNLDLSNYSYVCSNSSDEQQVSQESQASKMEFQDLNMQALRNTNYSLPSLGVHHAVATSSIGLGLGDYASDEFRSLLESFVNEQMHLQKANTHTNSCIQENVRLCSNQPQPANLLHDSYPLLPPSTHYD